MNYPMLLSPMKIGNVEIRNRSVMTAMGISLANLDGSASDEIIAYYAARAKGGCGLIINEITRVDDATGVGEVRQLRVTDDKFIPSLKKMTDAVHAEGAKMFCQLHHPGRQTYDALNEGGEDKVVSASDQPCGVCQQPTRAMTLEEVHGMVEKFIAGAVRAKAAGYDGVELHAAHGYLLEQFLSPYTNHREDEYGGSLENRMRIVDEIIDGIHQRCGKDYPISVRISVDECFELCSIPAKGLTLEETVTMCRHWEEKGIDVLNVTVGTYETMNTVVEPNSFKEGWRSHYVKAIKDAVSIPIMGNAVIRHPAFAEKLLAEGYQDFISMGRTWLAEPEWTKKIAEGRESELRKCISCLYCFETILTALGTGDPIKCALNPCTGHEFKYGALREDGDGRVVAVIGAGPAGLEAARVLALRKFRPIVFEAKARTGGQLNLASQPPAKERIGELVDSMTAQVKALGVEIRYNTPATAETIQALKPYAVVVATGGTPIVPKSVKGIDSAHVYTNEQVLSGEVKLENKKVVVVGARFNGLETAEYLAERGNTVNVIEMSPTIGEGIYFQVLLDLTGSLAKLGVPCLPNRELLEVQDGKVVVRNTETNEPVALDADAVVLSVGTKSVNGLAADLAGGDYKLVSIGDAAGIGRIGDATRTAYETCAAL